MSQSLVGTGGLGKRITEGTQFFSKLPSKGMEVVPLSPGKALIKSTPASSQCPPDRSLSVTNESKWSGIFSPAERADHDGIFSRHALTPPSSQFTVPKVFNLQPGESVLETSKMPSSLRTLQSCSAGLLRREAEGWSLQKKPDGQGAARQEGAEVPRSEEPMLRKQAVDGSASSSPQPHRSIMEIHAAVQAGPVCARW